MPRRGDSAGWQVSTWVCAYGKCLLWNPSVKNQRFLPAPFHKGASGVPPVSMRTVAFCDSLLPLQCPVSAACRRTFSLFTLHYSLKKPGLATAVEIEAQTKAPLAKGGWFGEAKPGGFRGLAGFHMGLFYRKAPTVNPSVAFGASSLPEGAMGCGA